MLNLQNKNILITGGSKGLGFALAKNLWGQGANLFLVSRTRPKFAFDKIHSDQLYVWKNYDLSDLNESYNLFIDFFEYFKSIDVLINNAAIQEPIGKIWEIQSSQWEDNVKLNLFVPIRLSKLFINRMIIQKYGKIINLSGGGATSSRPNFSAYAVAKTGLVRFSEILADELQESGHGNIFINCVAPGTMNTQMMQEILNNPNAGYEEYKNAKKIEHNKNTMNDAIDLINWLISEDSNITGRLISAKWDNWGKALKREYVSDNYLKLRRYTAQ